MNTPNTTEVTLSAPDSANSTNRPKFTPRQMRALWALWNGPLMREALDRAAGVSNGPQLVADLVAKGIDIHCELVKRVDRDGRACWPGLYSLTDKGRETLRAWGWGVAQ